MTTIDVEPPSVTRATTASTADAAERLARLAARRASQPAAAEQPAAASPAKPGKRRHPARKTRAAALALSLVSTGGLSVGFAALDGPSSSQPAASGGIVSAPTQPADASSVVGGAPTQPADASSVVGAAAQTAVAATVVNGDVFVNKWGPVQVQATFDVAGRLTAVDAVQVPFADRKSVRINDAAVPQLNADALTTQSAQVDTISGATYTSFDYEKSLQSAVDQARAAGLTELA